ncbi:organic cation transporter protein isoform X1 [Phthorimaea operculella]|nr:organic cation transporter protein isoform X1 [Phthorimaea operculella]
MPRAKDVDIDMDSVLAEVGHFGCYQLRLFLLVMFPVLISACAHSQYIFSTADTKYRCFVPECEARPGKWKPGAWAEWALISGSSCTRRKPLTGKCNKAAFSSTTQKCDSWVYENNDTIVSEFNLACKDWMRTLVGTMHSVGIFTAYTFVGIVSDTIGRRTTFIISIMCEAIMGVIRSFAKSYIFYIIFEYFDAVFGGGIYGTGFVLVVEMVGKHRRVLCGSALGCTFASGLIILAGIAWAVPYWRTLTLIIYVPEFIVITYSFCLSESVRWLIISLAGNKYVNFMLTAVFELPGCILSNFLLDRFGRKYTVMTAFLICGLLLFLLPFIPKKWSLFPAALAKTFISLAFVSVYIFTMELFPTNARHSLMAACSLIGRIGSIAAPQTPLLVDKNQILAALLTLWYIGMDSSCIRKRLLHQEKTLRPYQPPLQLQNLQNKKRFLEEILQCGDSFFLLCVCVVQESNQYPPDQCSVH